MAIFELGPYYGGPGIRFWDGFFAGMNLSRSAAGQKFVATG
jgi:hypothetical protein